MKVDSVPTAAVGPILAQLIAERWPDRPDQLKGEIGGVEILAEKTGISADTIDNITRQQNERCSFDIADRLLCALGRPDIWRGQLLDVYMSVDLREPDPLPSFPLGARFACGHQKEGQNVARNGFYFSVDGERKMNVCCRQCRDARKNEQRRKVAVAA